MHIHHSHHLQLQLLTKKRLEKKEMGVLNCIYTIYMPEFILAEAGCSKIVHGCLVELIVDGSMS